MCDVPSIAVFCSETIECFPGTASKLLLLLLLLLLLFGELASRSNEYS
jgi:hypothetical protein